MATFYVQRLSLFSRTKFMSFLDVGYISIPSERTKKGVIMCKTRLEYEKGNLATLTFPIYRNQK